MYRYPTPSRNDPPNVAATGGLSNADFSGTTGIPTRLAEPSILGDNTRRMQRGSDNPAPAVDDKPIVVQSEELDDEPSRWLRDRSRLRVTRYDDPAFREDLEREAKDRKLLP